MEDLRNHEEQLHYKFQCEICKKRTKSEKGLKSHKTRLHPEDHTNLVNVKNAAIREAQKFGASFQNVKKKLQRIR